MSSFHEFHEPIAVETPLGPGRAILVERTPHDYLWTVALETRALVSFTQDRIRICKSYTHRRGISDEEMRGIIARTGLETEAMRKAWERDCQPLKRFHPGDVHWQHY